MKLQINKKLSNSTQKVYCQEEYAEELLQMYNSASISQEQPRVPSGDLKKGDVLKIMDISPVNNHDVLVSTEKGDIIINMNNERQFLKVFGVDLDQFMTSILLEESKELIKNYSVTIISVNPHLRGSFMSGFVSATKEEMLKEIKNPSKVYKAKVISKNNGGFMIKLNGGITGFLPGSLAAANIVKDFDKMVGKDIYVMVDDYLWSSKMFVFSVKKYIQHVLPQKIKELDLDKKYTGTITDTSKFGIFIEFCEIFTGLLHTSKMSPELLQKFNKRELKSGQEIDFWILSNNDNKIILTDLDATLIRKQKEELIEELVQKNSVTGTIIAIKEWGFLAKIGRTPLEDIIGVCYKKTKKEIGNQIDCKVNWNRDAGKIILDLV